MSTVKKPHVVDVEEDGRGSSSEGIYSDSTDDEEHRCSSKLGSEIVGVSEKERRVSVSESSVDVDLECGVSVTKAHLAKIERDCRICHMGLDAANLESGFPIELGCSCKSDLAAAHKKCAETWFKIKGNKTCEICGSIARNVSGASEVELMEHWSEANDAVAPVTAPMHPTEARNFWQGQRILNFLLACMVFAFVMSWLFHYNIHS